MNLIIIIKYLSIKNLSNSNENSELIIEGLKHLNNEFCCIASVNDIFYTNNISRRNITYICRYNQKLNNAIYCLHHNLSVFLGYIHTSI